VRLGDECDECTVVGYQTAARPRGAGPAPARVRLPNRPDALAGGRSRDGVADRRLLGGAAGYRPLAPAASPQSTTEFDDWVVRTLLDPGRALYSRVEAEFLLREDPRITHRTLYYDLLSAVAQGAWTPTRIGGLLQQQRSAVVGPLQVLESTGYLRKEQDLLKSRNPVITVADPVIRFNQLITLPLVDMIEHRRARQAWRESRPTFHSKILGPHFEGLARQWTRSFAPDEAGLRAGVAGTTQVPDPQARTTHEVDVLALAPGERPQSAHARIALIGEAKAKATVQTLR
jgi:uncharacterized protein